MRQRDGSEAKLFRNALYAFAHQCARRGYEDSAGYAVTRMLEIDPEDRMNVVGMAIRMGVIPARAAEASAAMTM